MARRKVLEIEIPEDVVRRGERAVGIYVTAIVEHKTAPRMAEMFALQQAPRLMTDSVFMEGSGRLGDVMSESHLEEVLAGAKKHGFRPNPNDMYMPTLARFPGDPEAFVSHAGGRYYVKKLLEKRGAGGEGVVKVKSREPSEAPKRKHRLAPDIVNRTVALMRQEKPELREVPIAKLKAQVIETHGQK